MGHPIKRSAKKIMPHIRNFTELFLVPTLAAILPWSLCFRLFHRLVKLKSLYKGETEATLAGVASITPVIDIGAWREATRMVRLVDHADLYLSIFRSDAWLRRHVTVSGDWPKGSEPFVAITFHWGAGMWALRHMRANGRRVSVLARGLEKDTSSRSMLCYQYAKLRLFELARAGGSENVLTGKNSLYEIKRKLKAGRCIVGLMDIPVERPRNYLSAILLGKTAYFPRGLCYLAANSGVPVVVYSMCLDRQSGRRNLIISPPLQFENEDELLEKLASRLNELIDIDPPAWHQWAGVQSFFQKGDGLEHKR